MTVEIFKFVLGILLILFGVLILIFKFLNPLPKDVNEFGKAAHYQIIVLGIILVIFIM